MYTRVLKTILEERASCEDNIMVGEGCDKP